MENETRSFSSTNYGDDKLDKSRELNQSMSIRNSEPDEYDKKIHNIGGGEKINGWYFFNYFKCPKVL